jgi:hypothetical protein
MLISSYRDPRARTGFVDDSPLEERRFELSVPP